MPTNKQEEIKNKALNLFISQTKIQKEEITSIEYLLDGYTNNSFLINTLNGDKYIVRIGSVCKHINRKNEYEILEILSKNNESDILYFNHFNGDMIRKFIVGHTPNYQDIHSKTFLNLLAKKISSFHKIKINQKILVNDYYAYKDIKLPIDNKYEIMYYHLLEKNKNLPLVLSHNDLSPWNIIYNDEKKEIHFIDFEWIRLNNIYFDIATFIHQADLYDTDEYYYFVNQFEEKINLQTLEEFLYIGAFFTYQWTFSSDSYKDTSGFRNIAYNLMMKIYKKLKK